MPSIVPVSWLVPSYSVPPIATALYIECAQRVASPLVITEYCSVFRGSSHVPYTTPPTPPGGGHGGYGGGGGILYGGRGGAGGAFMSHGRQRAPL